ncbi:hypothetical protein [Thermoactinospora rubra]|nr:hypothetical protein [Thermoactinospora rubra]
MGPDLWDYLRGAAFLLYGAISWAHHTKIIYRHARASRRGR